MGFGGGALLQKEKVGARRKLCEVNLLSCGVEGWVGRLLSTTGFTGNTCVRAAQRPETGSSAQDLSTLPMGV